MKSGKIIVRGILLSAALVLTVGCSNDEVEETRRESVPVELSAYVSDYTEIEPMSPVATRADNSWIPSGYKPYTELTGVGGVMRTNENAPIAAFFTQDAIGSDPSVLLPRKFSFAVDKWRIREEEVPASGPTTPYQLYGYIPYTAATPYNDSGDGSTIEPNDTYADGAKLTLRGLNSVMNQDVCVIVGAKEGASTTEVTGLQTGKFSCVIQSGENVSNNVFLLFDHLYAALRFRFRVDEDYAKLRTIKLKRLELMAYDDEDCTIKVKKKVKTTVTLKANETNSSPIVGDIIFEPDGNDVMLPVAIYDNETNPVVLPSGNSYTDNMGFVPKTESYYKLISTYDVYDMNNNLIRQNCTAENKISPRSLFQKQSLDRGYMYTLRLTVKPTYIYVLSEPDLVFSTE